MPVWAPSPNPSVVSAVRTSASAASNAGTLQAEIDALSTAGGGELLLPRGTITTQKFYIKTGVVLRGQGRELTTLKLGSAENTELCDTYQFATFTTTTDNTGASPGNWGFRDLTLDGDEANQSVDCHVLRTYGWSFYMGNVVIRRGGLWGWYSEFAGQPPIVNARETHVPFVHDIETSSNGQGGLWWKGPADTPIHSLRSWRNNRNTIGANDNTINFPKANYPYSNILIDVGGQGAHILNSHSWANAKFAVEVLAAGCLLSNSQFEMGVQGQVKIGPGVSRTSIAGCHLYYPSGITYATDSGRYGLVVGEDGGSTVYATNAHFVTSFCEDGAIWLSNAEKHGTYRCQAYQASSTFAAGTAAHTSSHLELNGYASGTTQAAAQAAGKVQVSGPFAHTGASLGFYATAPIAKPTVTGAKGGNAALTSLCAQLAALGLITDSTS